MKISSSDQPGKSYQGEGGSPGAQHLYLKGPQLSPLLLHKGDPNLERDTSK